MEFSLIKQIDEYEIKYQGKNYLMKIIVDKKKMKDSVLLYDNNGKLMDDKLTVEIYKQYILEC